MRVSLLLAAFGLSACAQTSPVMDTGNGTYLISARAAPARGGATGAHTVAYQDAQQFCAQRGGRPVVIGANERDVYQSSMGGGFSGTPTGGYSGGLGGSTMASGQVSLRFRCQ